MLLDNQRFQNLNEGQFATKQASEQGLIPA